MDSKQAKTPPLSSKTKILCFDVETNGLHGDAFAVGAVVMDSNGVMIDEFTARTKINGQVNPWVEKNVLPVVQDMPLTHTSEKDLREAFWKWFVSAEETADYVLVGNGYPVEYRFLMKCQEANLEERYWQHPFPILDLFSLLIQIGDKSSKSKLLGEIINEHKLMLHNPLDDAKMTALAAFRAFQLSGRID